MAVIQVQEARRGFVTSAPPLGKSAPLDGLRGVAILVVLLVHANYVNFESLAAGVDLFFVVSGFLITTLLLEEHATTGTIDVRNFFVRRACRLLPVLYIVLAGTVIGALVIGHPDFLRTVWNDVAASLLYSYHAVHPVHVELVTGAVAPVERPLIQMWSLSVEEHFYAIAVLGVLLVVVRNWVRPAIAVCCGVWAVATVARLTGHVGYRLMWYQRPDALLVGCAIGFLNAKVGPLTKGREVALRRAGIAGLVVAGAVVLIGTTLLRPLGVYVPFLPGPHATLQSGWYWGEFGFSVVSVGVALLVWSIVRMPEQAFGRLMSARWLQAIGRRSYAIYVVHVPLAIVMKEGFSARFGMGPTLLLYLPTLVVCTEFLHRVVEPWGASMRRRFVRIKLPVAA